jgi:hypothetical protein
MFEEMFPCFPHDAWTPLAVGILCAALVLLTGRVRRLRRLPAPPAGSGVGEPPPTDPFLHGSRSEKRASLRRGGTQVPVLLSEGAGKARLFRGIVVDRSMGGLAVAVEAPISPDTVLSVRTVAHHPEMPWVPVVVRSCRQEGGYSILGCQFLRPQPWGILLLFG